MLGYYLSTIIVIYIIYLILTPIIFNINIKLYINKIGLKFNNETLILSIALILSMIIGFCLRKPIALSEHYWAWLYLLQPPMVEELLFRGIIPYLLYSKYKNKIFAFIISSILFSGIHILLGINAIIYALLLGSILLMIRIQCTSIIPPMIIHYIINSHGTYAWVLCSIVLVIYEFHWIKNRYNNSKLLDSFIS
ncbi:CPBP family intramembrane glutamic endopeptidase [Sarcina ventriculi]|uniref:CPBP family intramembrane glutamic endopeptidase n=1 Tax=Sarcina ventriculi TaxID=1267 RepID=UPI00073F85FD|nr:CPBP family intramembrane glutamic endopeptidase [Sarcina ventriculi]